MKTLLRIACAVALAVECNSAAAPAHTYEGKVSVYNESDAWVWVTAYDMGGPLLEDRRRALGSFCVRPHSTGTRIMNATLYDVRAEVTHTNCTHPVMLDRTLGWGGNDTPYYVTGSNGTYKFWHTRRRATHKSRRA